VAVEGLWIRLYFDHNAHLWLAEAVRRHGFEVIVAKDVGNAAASDEEHLRWATAHGRALFTYDRNDFPRLNEEWHARGESHAGIIVSVAPPELPPSTVLRRLLCLLDAIAADEIVNRLFWLNPRWESDLAHP
jgi:hypothetical protein